MTCFLDWLKGILSSTFNVSVKSRKMSDNSGTFNGNKVKNMGNVDIKGNEREEKKQYGLSKESVFKLFWCVYWKFF